MYPKYIFNVAASWRVGDLKRIVSLSTYHYPAVPLRSFIKL